LAIFSFGFGMATAIAPLVELAVPAPSAASNHRDKILPLVEVK